MLSPSSLSPPSSSSRMILKVNVFKTFFRRHIECLPNVYSGLCSNRMTLLYFCVNALEVLDAVDTLDADAICKWILAQQVSSKFNPSKKCGFRGSPSLGLVFDPFAAIDQSNEFDEGHIAMTYTALCLLVTLGNGFDGVDREGIIDGLRFLQRSNGSFAPVYHSDETDTRFVFCACAISTFLNDWSAVDKKSATEFLLSCQSYDGAFGLRTSCEGHGGATYCAVAALYLMGTLNSISAFRRRRLLHWCMNRQGDGFNGRPNKPSDSCYSYWVGGTIKLLQAHHLTRPEANRAFNFRCISAYGGFGKHPGNDPDLLHSYCGTAGLSLMDLDMLAPFCASLGISQRVAHSIDADAL